MRFSKFFCVLMAFLLQAMVAQAGTTDPWLVDGQDFDGDGNADLVFSIPGTTRIQLMNGTSVGSQGFISTSSDLELAAIGDVSGDGKADLIFLGKDGSAFNRLARIYIMDGTSSTSNKFLNTGGYALKQIGDVSGDEKADLIWRNGDWVRVHVMDGSAVSETGYLKRNTYTIVTLADLSGDGKKDIIYHGSGVSANFVRMDIMNGKSASSTGYLSRGGGVWSVADVVDTTGDSKADLIYTGSGAASSLIRINEMDGSSKLSQGYIVKNSAFPALTDSADVTGDGKVDLLFEGVGSSTNYLRVNVMNGTTTGALKYVTRGGSIYSMGQTGDVTGDGVSDLIMIDSCASSCTYRYTEMAASGTSASHRTQSLGAAWSLFE